MKEVLKELGQLFGGLASVVIIVITLYLLLNGGR